MRQFSLLVRVHQPDTTLLQRMLSSVLAQSNNDWELVLVVSEDAPNEEAIALMLADGLAQVRVAVRPKGELLAWSCNALLPTLGDWIGFLGQHDQLTPDALNQMGLTLAAHPQAKVVYSDEESLGRWGQVSLPFAKGAIDPIRILFEEYLRDFALIQKSWLTTVHGFDPLASDQPRHDLYLRLLELVGVAGFAHTPERLYRRHRNRLAPRGTDPRNKPYLPGYDLDAVRRHLQRTGVPAKVSQVNGTVDTNFQFSHSPSVTVLLVLGDDIREGKARLLGIGLLPTYKPWSVRVLFRGASAQAFDYYSEICHGLHYPFKQILGNLPAALNQEASATDTDLILFLQGMPLNAGWLSRLVAVTHLPHVVAVGPSLMTPIHLIEGGPWDSRGAFNQLAVPHSVCALSPACLLIDSRTFHQVGGFDQAYPTLYGMDLTLRLAQAGGRCARTPKVHVQANLGPMPEPEELDRFRTAWAGWQDPYGLHQLP